MILQNECRWLFKRFRLSFSAGLAMGSSRPWPEVMKVMTGQEKMDASAIREYFKPLEDWLVLENAKLTQTPGWQS